MICTLAGTSAADSGASGRRAGHRPPDLRQTDDLGRGRLLRQCGSGTQQEHPHEQTNAPIAIPWHRLTPPVASAVPLSHRGDHITPGAMGLPSWGAKVSQISIESFSPYAARALHVSSAMDSHTYRSTRNEHAATTTSKKFLDILSTE
jgi:hypothetical protein